MNKKVMTLIKILKNPLFSNKNPLALYFIIILLPVLTTTLLVYFCFHVSITDFHVGWIDEVIYRQEILTFKDVGFNGGYFSSDEQIAKSSFSHFGNHGPIFALIYGFISRVFGWSEYSVVIINTLLLCLSITLFLYWTKPDRNRSILLLAILGLYFPIILYQPSSMQESLNQAIGILIAGFLVMGVGNRRISAIQKVSIILVLIIASLMRITWIVAAFPIIYFMRRKKSLRWFCISILLCIAFSATMLLFYNFFVSPFTEGFLYIMLHQPTIIEMIKVLWARILQNTSSLIRLKNENQELATLFHYQYIVLIVTFFFVFKKDKASAITNLFLLIIPLMVNIAFYVIGYWGDYRTLSPFMLIAAISLVFIMDQSKLNKGVLALFIISNVIFLPSLFKTFKTIHVDHFHSNPPNEFTAALAGVEYENEVSPWCNSLLTNHGSYEEFQNLAPGIGINYLLSTDSIDFQPRSHYLLVPQSFLEANNLTECCPAIQTMGDDVFCEILDDGCHTDSVK